MYKSFKLWSILTIIAVLHQVKKNILCNHIIFAEMVYTNSCTLGNFPIPVWYILLSIPFLMIQILEMRKLSTVSRSSFLNIGVWIYI